MSVGRHELLCLDGECRKLCRTCQAALLAAKACVLRGRTKMAWHVLQPSWTVCYPVLKGVVLKDQILPKHLPAPTRPTVTELVPACRFNKASRMRKTAKERAKQLRALLASLVPRAALGGPQAGPWGGGNYQQLRQLAFVVTDIEASTAQAAQNSAAYSLAQEIHDTVRPWLAGGAADQGRGLTPFRHCL